MGEHLDLVHSISMNTFTEVMDGGIATFMPGRVRDFVNTKVFVVVYALV